MAFLVLLLNFVEWLIPDNLTGKLAVLNTMLQVVITQADNAVCALFFVDFLLRRVPTLLRWGRGEPEEPGPAGPLGMRVAGRFLVAALDLLSCVPSSMAVGLSGNVWRALRAARRFRIFQAVRVLKATEVLGLLVGEHRSLSVGLLVSFFSFSVWIGGAILVLAFELDNPSASIHSAADALWWSASTMTTVGYGDVAPVTPGGRVVAMILMLGGISVFGAMSGLITGFVFNKQEEKRSDNQGGTAPKAAEPLEPGLPSPRLQKVEEEVQLLRKEVAELRELMADVRDAVVAREPEPKA
mmetsp:Transcript_34969/g.103886  ORF Transcript_34969/g.103886 Transcript_34969/m.103886 type:complete len:298 (+) Transcript_34969:3-896(+)